MTVDKLALADLNFAEMCRGISRNVGGRVLEVDGLLMWAGAHPSPAIVNGVILVRSEHHLWAFKISDRHQ